MDVEGSAKAGIAHFAPNPKPGAKRGAKKPETKDIVDPPKLTDQPKKRSRPKSRTSKMPARNRAGYTQRPAITPAAEKGITSPTTAIGGILGRKKGHRSADNRRNIRKKRPCPRGWGRAGDSPSPWSSVCGGPGDAPSFLGQRVCLAGVPSLTGGAPGPD